MYRRSPLLALWTRTLSQVWTCVKCVPKKSIVSTLNTNVITRRQKTQITVYFGTSKPEMHALAILGRVRNAPTTNYELRTTKYELRSTNYVLSCWFAPWPRTEPARSAEIDVLGCTWYVLVWFEVMDVECQKATNHKSEYCRNIGAYRAVWVVLWWSCQFWGFAAVQQLRCARKARKEFCCSMLSLPQLHPFQTFSIVEDICWVLRRRAVPPHPQVPFLQSSACIAQNSFSCSDGNFSSRWSLWN